MVDTKPYAAVLAVVVAAGVIAFVVGVALLATRHGGVWAGVAVGGLSVGGAGAVGLYALGVVDEEARDARERNTGGRW
jgi:hypothetical protein